MDDKNLLKYKGWRYTTLAINTIEYEFFPYKIAICNINDFNNKIYIHKTIRCLIIEDVIKDLKFN